MMAKYDFMSFGEPNIRLTPPNHDRLGQAEELQLGIAAAELNCCVNISNLSVEKLKSWTPYIKPDQSPAYAAQVIGGETCAWEFGNYEEYPFYGYVTPSVLALFGDKLWGLGERDYGEDYEKALAAFIFGSEEYRAVFACVGSILPPRKGGPLTYADPETLSREQLGACMAKLRENTTARARVACRSYIGLLEEIAASLRS